MQKEKFECFLVVKKGYQQVTVEGYLGSARRFTQIVGASPSVEEATKYIQNMYQSDYSYSHKINTALGVENYMQFIGNPVRFGRQKKPKTIIKNTFTEAEVTRMIFNTKNIREKAIITLLAYSGIRNKELCDMRVRDFDAGTNSVRIIQGKGLKDGLSTISSECTKILMAYLAEYPREGNDLMFTTLRKNNHYKGGDLRKLVRIVAKRSKIYRRAYPHLFRHSLSVNMLLRGANIILLKKQLRHSLLETTLTYLNSIVFSEMNSYDKHAPSYI